MAQKGVTVANSAFPLYAIHMIGDQHVMIAGGGGQAKTGVGNAIVSSVMSLAVGVLGRHCHDWPLHYSR